MSGASIILCVRLLGEWRVAKASRVCKKHDVGNTYTYTLMLSTSSRVFLFSSTYP